jgi:hypothetical protein
MATVRLVKVGFPELLPATADPAPSASVLSGTLPKLQLDSSELGSAAFGDELGCAPTADEPGSVEPDSGTDALGSARPGAVVGLDEDNPGPFSACACDGCVGAVTG